MGEGGLVSASRTARRDALKIHAITTGTVRVHERQRTGVGRGPLRLLATLADRAWTARLPIHAWLIEHPEGLILVDTGDTASALTPGWFTSWNPYFKLAVRLDLTRADEVDRRLAALGFSPSDVRTVVMTHLHTDHAGGLSHFAGSDVVISAREYADSVGFKGKLNGYLPQHHPDWLDPTLVTFTDGPYSSFDTSQHLTAAGDVVLVPTPGHTPGHMSVIVEDEDASIFLAGDASYTEAAMLAGEADGVTRSVGTAVDTLRRIREMTASRPTVYLPSHDPESAARLAERTAAG